MFLVDSDLHNLVVVYVWIWYGVTRLNESCPSWAALYIFLGYLAPLAGSILGIVFVAIHGRWVVSCKWRSRISRVNTSHYPRECFMSHVWKSHAKHTKLEVCVASLSLQNGNRNGNMHTYTDFQNHWRDTGDETALPLQHTLQLTLQRTLQHTLQHMLQTYCNTHCNTRRLVCRLRIKQQLVSNEISHSNYTATHTATHAASYTATHGDFGAAFRFGNSLSQMTCHVKITLQHILQRTLQHTLQHTATCVPLLYYVTPFFKWDITEESRCNTRCTTRCNTNCTRTQYLFHTHMYICTHIELYIYMYIYVYIYTYTRTCAHTYAYTHTHIYIYV